MPSDKVTRALLSKTEFSRDEISKLSETEAWNLLYERSPPKPKDRRIQICFTGFKEPEKLELVSVAESNGLRSVSSVTKKLAYLVCGDNAGPSKMEKAAEQGAYILDASEFLTLMKTGELSV